MLDVGRRASLLRLGRHLQHPAAGDRRAACATARSPTSSATEPDVIAAGNIGCITQIAGGTALPVVHTVELLDWAYNGAGPAELKHLRGRITSMHQAFGEQAAAHSP